MGAASVDESAITGESAPVVRESGGDRSSITGGTTVLSDWLVARVTAEAGQSFLDKMIAMVESAARKKTPNEQALELLLIALTLVFLAVSLSLYLFGAFTAAQHGAGNPLGITSLVALFVCLAPTTIGALLSAIGIAGMSRLNAANVLATSGRAVEAAGDVDVLLLDKTALSRSATVRLRPFCPLAALASANLPMRLSWQAWPTRRPRDAVWWCSPRSASASASASWRSPVLRWFPSRPKRA